MTDAGAGSGQMNHVQAFPPRMAGSPCVMRLRQSAQVQAHRNTRDVPRCLLLAGTLSVSG